MNKVKTELDYYDGMDQLPEGVFKISPSSFNTFMNRPHIWYREQVLGEGTFEGNTATVIGTLVHHVAEKVAKGEVVDKGEMAQYVANHKDNEDVDTAVVLRDYVAMAERLVNDYVLKQTPTAIEDFVSYNLGNGVWVAGSVDVLDNGCIVDLRVIHLK